jgi:hypothetical protein
MRTVSCNRFQYALFLAVIFGVATGCRLGQKPGVSMKAARLAEGPIIIQRGDHFYLRYRRALEDGRYPLRSLLHARKTADAGYYFFGNPISHPEWGELVERPLAYDGLEELAQRRSIYWLDPDGTKHPIPVRREGQF